MKTLFAMLVVLGCMMIARPAMADDIGAVYKSKCQVCHGPDGKGSAAGQKLGVKDIHSPDVEKESDADLIALTKAGKGKMPAYDKKIPDDQIAALVKFMRGLK
jgi:cytochrome c6